MSSLIEGLRHLSPRIIRRRDTNLRRLGTGAVVVPNRGRLLFFIVMLSVIAIGWHPLPVGADGPLFQPAAF